MVFAVDGESIRIGQEKALFETASRMLDSLSPADAVGLIEMPGPTIDVTRDHEGVADDAQAVHRPEAARVSRLAITYGEAEAVEHDDRPTISRLADRACAPVRTAVPIQADRATVEGEIKAQSKQMLFDERRHTRVTLSL